LQYLLQNIIGAIIIVLDQNIAIFIAFEQKCCNIIGHTPTDESDTQYNCVHTYNIPLVIEQQ